MAIKKKNKLMLNFEQLNINPVENPREAYGATEQDEASLRAELAGAKNADEIMAIATKLKGVEGTKKDLIDIAREEALKQEKEIKMYDEAMADDELLSMFDEAKKEDAERTAAKEAEKLNAEIKNLRDQIAGKTPEEILAIAARMKEIEDEKSKINIDEEKAGAEKDKKQHNKILTELKNDKEKVEDLYGLNAEELGKLLESRGFLDKPLDSKDPDFNQKYEEFLNKKKKYDRVRVKLFDRVLSGKATEEEIKMAENHARQLSEIFGLSGFHSTAPESWYTNKHLLDALASGSKSNKEWIDYVRNSGYYTEEKLMKGGFEKIGEDGFRHTYRIQGF